MIEVRKYRNGRFWAVYRRGELITVCVYKKGAMAVKRALEGRESIGMKAA